MFRRRLLALTSALAALALVGTGCIPPDEPPPPDPPPPAVNTCFESSGELGDLRYVGPIDGADNAQLSPEAEGSCVGDTAEVTIVRSTGELLATATCEGIEEGFGPAETMVSLGYAAAPANLYLCVGSLPDPDPDPGPPAGTCFDAPEGQDIRFDGPLSASPNMSLVQSTDGSCDADLAGLFTAVVADDQESADAACEAIQEGFGPAAELAAFVIGESYDLFICFGSLMPPPVEPGTCFEGPANDLRYDGPPATAGNATLLSAADEPCDGQLIATATLVLAASSEQGDAFCESITPGSGPAQPLGILGYDGPPGLLICMNSLVYPPPVEPDVGECYDVGSLDLRYVGPADGVSNVEVFGDSGGLCSSPMTGLYTVVAAADGTEATATCEARGEGFGSSVTPLNSLPGSTFPVGWWLCGGSYQPPPPTPLEGVIECYQSEMSAQDVARVDEFGIVGNALVVGETEPPCSVGPVLQTITLVQAADAPTATDVCVALLGAGASALDLSFFGYGTVDVYFCQAPPP